MKRCSRCGETKEDSNFYKHDKARDGLQNYCKPCNKTASSAWEKKGRNSYKRKLRSLYGITIKEYEDMLDNQGHKCKICKSKDPKNKAYKGLIVDHCHVTGNVRGLLCGPCNTGLGSFRDSVVNLKTAAKYLEDDHFTPDILGSCNKISKEV